MSVLKEVLATPSRVLGVLRYVVLANRGKAVAQAELEAVISPVSLRGEGEGEEMAPKTIRECVKMGLLEEEDGKIGLHSDFARRFENLEELLPNARREIADLIFAENRPTNHDLARMIAWFLVQDAYQPPGRDGSWATAISNQQMIELLEVRAELVFDQFEYWSTFLGFNWSDSGSLVPDPTAHLRTRLDGIFGKADSLSFKQFMDRAAAAVPVLEGGVFRSQIEERLPADHIRPRGLQNLSTSTSLALKRLEDEGLIALEGESDSPTSRHLQLLDETRTFARISRATRAKGRNA